ncbi:hypothetical protein B0A52_01043 [Exophiala mesophila]|uniref:histone acetyltransferase n=1 Tax=Exophiala mesophila TaxID=212818 RepID=A0A438NGC6_EXOME|nr:hypothetical protein B0A52_01043 [Exophiala mesophila]
MPSVTDGFPPLLGEGSPHRVRRESLRILNRNIGQVVLGNLLFDTWYYSPYPDSIIQGVSNLPSTRHVTGAADLRNGITHSLTKEGPLCAKLYVCSTCFRYCPEERDYVQHLIHHRARREQGLETQPVPESALQVYDWDGYAVWEVDGEKEKLYCQNLSLFGKLFLEQKSVFFDTAGFKYYALTYTPPLAATPPGAKGRGRKRSFSALDDDLTPRAQVLGFFSKENLSWDSNNLACILIFPPFQHRQLGQLLMAVSYKLSGWEWEGGVIGGPEKPLSAMGRKSYLRFWSERIARFMMGQTADADAQRVFAPKRGSKRRTVKPRKEEMTVKELGDRTGMLGEDVVAALNEMGICKVTVPRRKKKNSLETQGGGSGPSSHTDQEQAEDLATVVVHRSKILEWAESRGVDLTSAVREEGFLGEWALSDMDESGTDASGTRDHSSDDNEENDSSP